MERNEDSGEKRSRGQAEPVSEVMRSRDRNLNISEMRAHSFAAHVIVEPEGRGEKQGKIAGRNALRDLLWKAPAAR
ncbi:hypothetical protein KM043_016989 [Ampulex compressa]|nr:hypothetical protein KM043_016989 [Ampulex compressa]